MNVVSASIKDLVNALRVYAALEVQSVIPGKIIAASFHVNEDGDKNIYEGHFVDFKRADNNHVVRINLFVNNGFYPEEPTSPHGSPCLKINADDVHGASTLVSTILSMLGGVMTSYDNEVTGQGDLWTDVPQVYGDWLDLVDEGRLAQIKLVDRMHVEGMKLLNILGTTSGDSLLDFTRALTDAEPVSPWPSNQATAAN